MIDVALGFDIGNGTIKIVVLSEKKKVIDSVYLKNVGIINTLQKGLKIIYKRNKNINVISCGMSGAGRNFASKIVGVDILKTEILAFSIGCLHFIPNANTLMDMGQEDGKMLIIRDKVLVDFTMNSICSAGCGSYLENVAVRFGIKIEDFAGMALKSTHPISISGKCAVFGTSNCVSKLNSGSKIEDILMGVSESLVRNFIYTLSKNKELKPPYIFGGGISLNKSVVQSLEKELNHKVIILKYSTFLTAIGMAILSLEDRPKKTKFKGFLNMNNEFTTKTYYGTGCTNECEITQLFKNKELIGYIGNRCEKCIKKK